MQLVDALEDRLDRVSVIETPKDVHASFFGGSWSLVVDGKKFVIAKQAWDKMLNLIKIPIKYIDRCVEEDSVFLAESNVNFWLEKAGELSFLIEDGVISQVFAGSRVYLPSIKVNDLMIDYLGDCSIESWSIDGDVYTALYLMDEEITINGDPYLVGVRVLYSDCFSLTPRFDGVLYDKHFGGVLPWPTEGRKFRVTNNTLHQVIDQIHEFTSLSVAGLRENVIDALESSFIRKDVGVEQFINRLCNDLRFNKRVRDELVEQLNGAVDDLDLCLKLTSYVNGKSEQVDSVMARKIQLAVSNYIVSGVLK